MNFLLSTAVTWEDPLGWGQREGSLVSYQNLLDLREEDCASYLELLSRAVRRWKQCLRKIDAAVQGESEGENTTGTDTI